MSWRLAKSLTTLRSQVNAEYPKRSKASDGTIGDTAHQAVASDHNPNSKGVVTALDLTHDLRNGFDAHKLADLLIKKRHPNLEYVISNKRIAGAWTNWKWAKYTGSNPHTKHIHISVGSGGSGIDGKATHNYDSTTKWTIKEEEVLTNKNHLKVLFRQFVARDPKDSEYIYYLGKDASVAYEKLHKARKDLPNILEQLEGQKKLVHELAARIPQLEKALSIKDNEIKRLKAELSADSDTVQLNALGQALSWFIKRIGLKG